MASLTSAAGVVVKLKWGKEAWPEFTVDTSSDVAALKAQLFSLTNVPPDRQKLMCKGSWKGVLADDADLSAMKFKPKKSQIVLMGSAATESVADKPKAAVVFMEDLTSNEQVTMGSMLPPGLNNLGNTCYMNSTLQCLRAIPELKTLLKSYSRMATPLTSFDRFVLDLSSLYGEMETKYEAVTPYRFVGTMRQTFAQFAERGNSGHYMQQDSEEFLGAIFNSLKSAVTKDKVGDDCVHVMGDASNACDAIFGLELEQVDVCQESEDEARSVTRIVESKMRVNIDGGASSADKVDFMFQGMHKALKGQVEKNAPLLGRNAIWERTQRINRLPQILCVQYMRFYWKKREPTAHDPSTGTKCKMLRPVAFNATIDMYEFCTPRLQGFLKRNRDAEEAKKDNSTTKTDATEVREDNDDAALASAIAMSMGDDDACTSAGVNLPETFNGEYEVFAVVSHKGRSADSGHYIGWVRQEGEKWICFDDEQCDVCETSDILMLKGGGDRDMGYLLFYRAKK
jgi:ubiquitin carboxyl-terminal hydrolase 14